MNNHEGGGVRSKLRVWGSDPLLLGVTGLKWCMRGSDGQIAQFDATHVDPEDGCIRLHRKIGKIAKFLTVEIPQVRS